MYTYVKYDMNTYRYTYIYICHIYMYIYIYIYKGIACFSLSPSYWDVVIYMPGHFAAARQIVARAHLEARKRREVDDDEVDMGDVELIQVSLEVRDCVLYMYIYTHIYIHGYIYIYMAISHLFLYMEPTLSFLAFICARCCMLDLVCLMCWT